MSSCPHDSLSCVLSLLFAAIYAYVIVKDNVTDDEDKIIEDLKMAIKQHIGSFAVPHCFMVTNFVKLSVQYLVHVYVVSCSRYTYYFESSYVYIIGFL